MKEDTKLEHILPNKLNISKLQLNTTKNYKLNKSQDWVRALLVELNEKGQAKSSDEFLELTTLEMDISITKMFKPEYGEYILMKASIYTAFVTQCVRTLEDMDDSLSLDIKICLLNGATQKDESQNEELEIFEQNDMFELYFYTKGAADIAEVIHEQIYLHINQFPIKDSDSPLDWGKEPPSTKQ